MARAPHPNKEIEAAIRHAEANGWKVEKSSGHAWGRMKCPNNNPACRSKQFCVQCIWSTPRSAENHAKLLRKVVDKCEFLGEENG